MNRKKGFISVSIVYSFFLVFILLMIAILMYYVNKRYLVGKIGDNFEPIGDEIKISCKKGEKLIDCLFKSEYIEYKKIMKKSSKTDKDTSYLDFNKTFNSIKNYNKDSVKNAIKSKSTPNFSEPSFYEEGMFMMEDNYGESFYYRGAEDDNYVVFDNYVWRIIRINGNNTTRIIYQGVYDEENKTVAGDEYIIYMTFNLNGVNNALKNIYEQERDKYCAGYTCLVNGSRACENMKKMWINICESYKKKIANIMEDTGSHAPYKAGYMHSNFFNQVGYNEKYSNSSNSTLKDEVDSWYEISISDNSKNYLSDTIFCGDKNRICKYDWSRCGDITSAEASIGQYYYEAYDRIVMNKIPNLYCNDSGGIYESTEEYDKKYINRNLSRYTVDAQGKNFDGKDCYGDNCIVADDGTIFGNGTKAGFLGNNGDLDYPIAIISVDEMVLSGAVYNGKNDDITSNSFLKGNRPYWSMTLAYTDNAGGFAADSDDKKGTRYFMMNEEGKIQFRNDQYYAAAVRPVVNLKENILYCSGSGTASDPYIIGNGSCS